MTPVVVHQNCDGLTVEGCDVRNFILVHSPDEARPLSAVGVQVGDIEVEKLHFSFGTRILCNGRLWIHEEVCDDFRVWRPWVNTFDGVLGCGRFIGFVCSSLSVLL